MTIPDQNHESNLLKQAAAGDGEAMGQLLEEHRARLERVVQLRLDQRVQSRVNPSDVLQETYLEAAQRIREYLQNPEVPFFIWLRFLACQRVGQLHRHHMGRQSRDVGREVSIFQQDSSENGFVALADQLVGQLSSASTALQKVELRKRLDQALASMEPIDHEILVLRHFEQLTNLECAEILKLSPTAASNRYVRALERLRAQLAGDEELTL